MRQTGNTPARVSNLVRNINRVHANHLLKRGTRPLVILDFSKTSYVWCDSDMLMNISLDLKMVE